MTGRRTRPVGGLDSGTGTKVRTPAHGIPYFLPGQE